MAILKREGADKIYAAARLFREQALKIDGSLLTPGRSIWTIPALEDLEQRFVLSPDESRDSFDVKLERQLNGASDDTKQLMAELLLMHLLVIHGMNASTKRLRITRVLGWMQEPVEIPPEIDAALETGLASCGTHFYTRRDLHLRFFIDWMLAWKRLDSAERDHLLSDPWTFKEQISSIEIRSAWLQRNAILHFVFPETFERTIARSHKTALVEAFADLIGGPGDVQAMDEDKAIWAIRKSLESKYGPGFDFYDPEIRKQWDPPPEATAPLLDRVRVTYPGWQSFADERFVNDETNYKMAASAQAQDLLGADALRELIEQEDYAEVVRRVEQVAQSTNLLWLQMPREGDLSILYRQDFDPVSFSGALYDLLHGDGSSPERLERYVSYTKAQGLPAKWALPTYLLMMMHPETDFFVKPEATKWFLKQMDNPLKLGSKASDVVYISILEAAEDLQDQLASFEPKTLLDIQSYVWVAYRAGEASPRVLAEPFTSIFGDWDTAWWSFDVARKALEMTGVAGPEDERLAVTLVDGPSIHVDVSSWLLLTFGRDFGKSKHLGAAILKGSALHQQIGGGDGFAVNPSVTVGYLPLDEARSQEQDLWDAMSPALESARTLFADHRGSSYRIYNRAEIAGAIFDEAQRAALFTEGIPMTEPESGTVYEHIRNQRYHFPDWLVTDYLLSLATKPLVILSGISGTGKTKMAQLVSEFVAPEVMAPVARSLPEPSEGSILHEAKRVLLEHFYVAIRTRQADLFPLPERGSGLDVELRVPGLAPMPGRLQSVGGTRDLTLRLYLKGPARDWVRNQFKLGDYIRITPDGPDSTTIAVEHIPVDTVETLTPSMRIAFLSVRPDWTDNRALLGYFNPLLQRYQGTELLRLLLRAEANPDEPHFVVLDEMNLAKVEYYFSDFLSAMESGTEMVLHDADDDEAEAEELLPPRRLKVPKNVFFTGTVNVDETTYMFSPKVLDRANTIEFNQVNLADYGRSGAGVTETFGLRDNTTVDELLAASRPAGPQDWAALPATAQDRIRAIHGLMEEHNLHFGYRVANEIARYLMLTQEFVGDDQLDFALDLQVLQKVLPKLSGSRAKLERPLEALLEHLEGEGLNMSAAKVGRMLSTVRAVGFVSFVE